MMRSPEQQFALAKRLPINELAKVLQGQSDIVDMSTAQMVLRQKVQAQKAMQGMQAQNMAQGPKVVEQDLMNAGIGAMPVDVDVPEYAGGGIVAFDDGGPVQRYQNRGLVSSEQFGDMGRLSPEEIETNRLREQIRRRYAFTTSPLGRFTAPPTGFSPAMGAYSEYQARRAGLQDVLNALPNLNREQLEQLDISLRAMDQRPLVSQQTAPEAAKQTAPVTSAAELRKLETEAGDSYTTKPGLTPQQSAANIAAARPPVDPDDKGLGALTARPTAYADLMTQAREFVKQNSPEPEKIQSITDYVAAQKEALTAAGFDFNLVKNQISEIRAEKEQSKADRKEAVNLRLLEAGLGILGGESPYALVNVGKGAAPALKGLSEDIKDIKKIDRERDKAMRDLAIADNQISSGMGLGALKARDAAQERITRANENRATREASIFSTLTSADTQRFVAQQGVEASKAGRATDIDSRRYDKAREAAIKLVNEGVTKFGSPAEKEAEISRLTALFYQQALDAASGKVVPAASTARGRVVNGVYIPAGQ